MSAWVWDIIKISLDNLREDLRRELKRELKSELKGELKTSDFGLRLDDPPLAPPSPTSFMFISWNQFKTVCEFSNIAGTEKLVMLSLNV